MSVLALVCLIPNLMVWLGFAATLPAVYEPQALILTSRYNMAQGVNLGNLYGTSYVSMDATNSTVSRLTNFGKLEIFDIDTKTLKYNLFNSTKNPTNQSVRAYDILDASPMVLGVILTTNDAYLYNVNSNTSIVSFEYQQKLASYDRLRIQVFADEYYLYSSTSPIKQYIGRRTKQSGWVLTQFYESTLGTIIFNSKKCRANPTDKFYKAANWKKNCLVQVINCKIGGSCIQIFLDNNPACTSTEFNDTARDYFKLDWNHNCTKIMYEYKNAGIKIVDITTNVSTIVSYNVSSAGTTLNGFWFMDTFNIYISLLWTDGKFQIYSVTPNNTKVYESVVEQSTVTAYRRSRQMLFVSNGTALYAYNFGCNSSNFSLDPSGLCLPANVTINTTTNTSANNTTNVTTNSTTGTDATTYDNTTTYENFTYTNATYQNMTANVTDPIIDENATDFTNSTEEQIINNNITVEPLNQTIPTKQIDHNSFTNFIPTFFQSVQQAVSYSIFLIKILPIAAFFMRYINFWSICTLYLLPDLSLPEQLKEIIVQICSFLNFSVFKQIGLDLSINTKLIEKFSFEENQIFGFSSDILNSNIENVLLLCFSITVLAFTFGFSLFLTTENFFKKQLSSINYRMVILTQFFSIMQTFIFNFPIITQQSEQQFFREKVNMTFQNLLFIFSCFICCLTFITFESKIEDSDMKKNEKKREKYDWFFDCQCRVLLPIIATIKNNFFFLGFSSFFLWIPLFTAIKRDKLKILFILKALYLPIFNLCVILLQILRGKEMKTVQDQIVIAAIFIIFAAAVHQIVQFLVSLIYYCGRMLFKKDSKVADTVELQKFTDFIERIELDTYSQTFWTENSRESFTRKKTIKLPSNNKVINSEPNEQNYREPIFNIEVENQHKFNETQQKRRFIKIKTAKKPLTKHFIQESNSQKQGSDRSIERDLIKNTCLKDSDSKEEEKTLKKIQTTKVIVHNRGKHFREMRSKKVI